MRVRAVSLNRRDLMMVAGSYGRGGTQPNSVPLSDGAGEVIAVGAAVTRFKVGDRVAGIFFEDWLDGAPTAASLATARGGNAGGMLSEIVVTDAEGLVSIPAHLDVRGSRDVAVRRRHGVGRPVQARRPRAGDFVLLEGTGGVSVFGLQLAAAAGAKPIITSSSDAKLARARELGAFGTVNYRSNPEWQREVRALTGGAGVDQVLEVGGQDTLPRALEALGFGGHIAIIGGLSGFASDVPVGALMGLERDRERHLRRLARRLRGAQRILERAQDQTDRRQGVRARGRAGRFRGHGQRRLLRQGRHTTLTREHRRTR